MGAALPYVATSGQEPLVLMNPIYPANSSRPVGVGPKLFISYRRADSASNAGRIYDRLTAYFGREALFKDVDNIPIGANFEQVIAGVVTQSSIVLALVGPTWATIANEHGRRLDDPQDVVRLEIEASLRRGIPVIPVLVEGATMPDPAALPPSLRPLFAHGTMQVRNNPWFDGDMSQLATTVSRWLPLRSIGAAMPAGNATSGTTAPSGGAFPSQQSMPTRAPRRRWFTSPLGLVAAIVLIMAVALLSLAGAGLVGAGPFGHLGAISTPLATAPRQAAPTATPSEHIELNTPLTRPLTDWENDSDCAFASDGYHVTAPPHYTTYCVTPAAYDNFHLKARVHVPTGATRADYALFFRVKDNNNFDYISLSFKVFPSLPPTQVAGPGAATPTPNYDIQASWDASSHSNGNDAILGDGLTPAAHVTGDGDNLLEVYANGPTVTILVNGQQLGSFQDANNKVGKIGLGAEAGVAIYTSISVATLAT